MSSIILLCLNSTIMREMSQLEEEVYTVIRFSVLLKAFLLIAIVSEAQFLPTYKHFYEGRPKLILESLTEDSYNRWNRRIYLDPQGRIIRYQWSEEDDEGSKKIDLYYDFDVMTALVYDQEGELAERWKWRNGTLMEYQNVTGPRQFYPDQWAYDITYYYAEFDLLGKIKREYFYTDAQLSEETVMRSYTYSESGLVEKMIEVEANCLNCSRTVHFEKFRATDKVNYTVKYKYDDSDQLLEVSSNGIIIDKFSYSNTPVESALGYGVFQALHFYDKRDPTVDFLSAEDIELITKYEIEYDTTFFGEKRLRSLTAFGKRGWSLDDDAWEFMYKYNITYNGQKVSEIKDSVSYRILDPLFNDEAICYDPERRILYVDDYLIPDSLRKDTEKYLNFGNNVISSTQIYSFYTSTEFIEESAWYRVGLCFSTKMNSTSTLHDDSFVGQISNNRTPGYLGLTHTPYSPYWRQNQPDINLTYMGFKPFYHSPHYRLKSVKFYTTDHKQVQGVTSFENKHYYSRDSDLLSYLDPYNEWQISQRDFKENWTLLKRYARDGSTLANRRRQIYYFTSDETEVRHRPEEVDGQIANYVR